jgi:hypothetical protein
MSISPSVRHLFTTLEINKTNCQILGKVYVNLRSIFSFVILPEVSVDLEVVMAEDGQSLIIIEQFENHEIRKIWFKDEWWYSLVDVISVFSGTDRARKYWSDLKKKIQVEEGYSELSEKIGQLKRYSDP